LECEHVLGDAVLAVAVGVGGGAAHDEGDVYAATIRQQLIVCKASDTGASCLVEILAEGCCLLAQSA